VRDEDLRRRADRHDHAQHEVAAVLAGPGQTHLTERALDVGRGIRQVADRIRLDLDLRLAGCGRLDPRDTLVEPVVHGAEEGVVVRA